MYVSWHCLADLRNSLIPSFSFGSPVLLDSLLHILPEALAETCGLGVCVCVCLKTQRLLKESDSNKLEAIASRLEAIAIRFLLLLVCPKSVQATTHRRNECYFLAQECWSTVLLR